MADKLISIQLDTPPDTVGVRITTMGWAEEQDIMTNRDEAFEFLCAACDNGHRHVTVQVWSDER